MNTIDKYRAVFWRDPWVVRGPLPGFPVSTCMFPAVKLSFWKRILAEASNKVIYISAGLSDFEIPVPAGDDIASRVELFAICEAPIGGGEGGNEDVPTVILQQIANFIIEQKAAISVGHTLDFGEPFASNVQMSAILFGCPEGIDEKRICKCSKAQALIVPIPITQAELDFARREGVLALIDKFEANDVPMAFDVFRKSVL